MSKLGESDWISGLFSVFCTCRYLLEIWPWCKLTVFLVKIKVIFSFFPSSQLQTLCLGPLSAIPEGWSSSEVQGGERRAPGFKTASAHRKETREGKACYPSDPCWANPPIWKSTAARQPQEIDSTAHHWDRLEVGGTFVLKPKKDLNTWLKFNYLFHIIY